ncbi:MAG: hypothetical protein WBH77_04365 [Saccharofermentanales bacterium]
MIEEAERLFRRLKRQNISSAEEAEHPGYGKPVQLHLLGAGSLYEYLYLLHNY